MTAIEIGESLTIYDVPDLKTKWLAQGPIRETATVLGEHVKEVDCAGMQLLVSLEKWVTQYGGEITLLAPSPVLSDALQDVGLGHWVVAEDAA
jgi:anti-anti-sigma regulatory factor